jgi:hypothetical protein
MSEFLIILVNKVINEKSVAYFKCYHLNWDLLKSTKWMFLILN